MSAVVEMMEGLAEVAADPETPTHEIGNMARFIVAALQRTDDDTMNELASRLAPAIDISSPHAPVTFVLAGALVEGGADAKLLAPRVLAPVHDALVACAAYVDELRTEHGSISEEVWANATPPHAWFVLELIWRPVVAMLGSSKTLRARHQPSLEFAQHIAHLHAGGDWIATVLGVLDDEPLLVVHPASDRAFECTFGGVTTLLELQTLLQTELDITDERPPADVVACIRGEGPPMCETPGVWRFDLFPVAALDDNDAAPLPGGASPRELSRIETGRIVVLRDAEARSYGAHRSFTTMTPRLEVHRSLAASELAINS